MGNHGFLQSHLLFTSFVTFLRSSWTFSVYMSIFSEVIHSPCGSGSLSIEEETSFCFGFTLSIQAIHNQPCKYQHNTKPLSLTEWIGKDDNWTKYGKELPGRGHDGTGEWTETCDRRKNKILQERELQEVLQVLSLVAPFTGVGGWKKELLSLWFVINTQETFTEKVKQRSAYCFHFTYSHGILQDRTSTFCLVICKMNLFFSRFSCTLIDTG